VTNYKSTLRTVDFKNIRLDNRDCDTGKETAFGEYTLSDATYATLLDKLAEHSFGQTSPELHANILQYYARAEAPLSNKKATKDWAKTESQLQQLKTHGDKANMNGNKNAELVSNALLRLAPCRGTCGR
jgi:hypothetical protein